MEGLIVFLRLSPVTGTSSGITHFYRNKPGHPLIIDARRNGGASSTVGAVLLVAVSGILDHVTGFEISFSIFYLIPIILTAWFVRHEMGLTMCLFSAGTWHIVDDTSGHSYSQEWIPFWNATVRIFFFLIIADLTAGFKRRLQLEGLLARTEPLTGLKNARV